VLGIVAARMLGDDQLGREPLRVPVQEADVAAAQVASQALAVAGVCEEVVLRVSAQAAVLDEPAS